MLLSVRCMANLACQFTFILLLKSIDSVNKRKAWITFAKGKFVRPHSGMHNKNTTLNQSFCFWRKWHTVFAVKFKNPFCREWMYSIWFVRFWRHLNHLFCMTKCITSTAHGLPHSTDQCYRLHWCVWTCEMAPLLLCTTRRVGYDESHFYLISSCNNLCEVLCFALLWFSRCYITKICTL